MKFVIQRVLNASCTVNNEIIGKIDNGLCVFIGVSDSDNKSIADKMIKKLINMRIFSDENDKTNLSLLDVSGSLLLISQFTLYADCRKRNSFSGNIYFKHINAYFLLRLYKRVRVAYKGVGQFAYVN